MTASQTRKLPRSLQWLSAAALGLATLAHAQETAPTPHSLEEALHQLSDAAGIIFVGEVIAIRHRAGENGSSGVVEVDFRVDQAIRGCSAGGIYTLREWAGLWAGSDQRYRVGQRLLMLLHSPGAAGMSSPVGGMAGAIPIRGAATALAPQTGASTSAAATAASLAATTVQANTATVTAASPVADLRWVGTRMLRTVSYQTGTTRLATVATAKAITESSGSQTATTTGDASTAAQQAPISVVVNMLAAWQGKEQATVQGTLHAAQ